MNEVYSYSYCAYLFSCVWCARARLNRMEFFLKISVYLPPFCYCWNRKSNINDLQHCLLFLREISTSDKQKKLEQNYKRFFTLRLIFCVSSFFPPLGSLIYRTNNKGSKKKKKTQRNREKVFCICCHLPIQCANICLRVQSVI